MLAGILLAVFVCTGCDLEVHTGQVDAADAIEVLDAGGDSGAADTAARDVPGDSSHDATDAVADTVLDAVSDTWTADTGADTADTADTTAPTDTADSADSDASWGPCSVAGRPGECLDTSLCDGGRTSTPGYCPGPANIQCCTEPAAGTCDPAVYVYPDPTLVQAPGDPGCPDGMVALDATVCIDAYEAALVEVLSDGTTTPWSPYHNPGSRRVRAVSVADAVPQGYITGYQAEDACLEAGKRLCSDTEWLAACRGSQSWTYPYGPTRQDGVCNDARAVHPAIELFGTSASWIWSELGNACINQLPSSLTRTGSHLQCVSEVGAYDLMGNLHEWTADPAGTFRGGYYVDTRINGDGCLYRTTAHDRSHWDYSTGFRCCADRQ